MKNRYRVFRRGWGTYYCEDLQTGKQETLRTRDKDWFLSVGGLGSPPRPSRHSFSQYRRTSLSLDRLLSLIFM
jgi:hypothetical protein